jgi:hypothetical protein
MVALVLGKSSIDARVYRLVERVAFDTTIGFNVDIVEAVTQLGGSAARGDIQKTTCIPYTCRDRRRADLKVPRVLAETCKVKPKGGGAGRSATVWKISGQVRRVWKLPNVQQDYAKRGAHAPRRM